VTSFRRSRQSAAISPTTTSTGVDLEVIETIVTEQLTHLELAAKRLIGEP